MQVLGHERPSLLPVVVIVPMYVNVFLALVSFALMVFHAPVFAVLILPLDGAVMLLLLHALVLFLVLLALGFVGLAVHLGAVLGARVMLGLVHLVRLGSVVLLGFAMSLVGGFGLQHGFTPSMSRLCLMLWSLMAFTALAVAEDAVRLGVYA